MTELNNGFKKRVLRWKTVVLLLSIMSLILIACELCFGSVYYPVKDIIKVFSFPTEIEIQSNESKIDFSVNLKYNKLKVYYTLYYFVEDLKKPENHSLTYRLEKLYLNKNENIKVGDDIRKVLPKIKKYLKKIGNH